MRRVAWSRVALAAGGLAMVVGLAGCEQARRALGTEKQSPDEFAVVTRAPLTMPPDYGLRPPAPGTQRPQEKTPRESARGILLGGAARGKAGVPAATGKFSRGEFAFLRRAGALNADPTIRQKVNRESSAIANAEDSFLTKIIFWQEHPPPGTVIDAAKEARRLREASAMGDAPNKGKVPTIKRKKKGLLEGLF